MAPEVGSFRLRTAGSGPQVVGLGSVRRRPESAGQRGAGETVERTESPKSHFG